MLANDDHKAQSYYYDVVKCVLSPSFPIYAMADHHTFSIGRIDDNTFQINTIVESDSSSSKDILFVYSICAREAAGRYFLFSKLKHNSESGRIHSETYGSLKYFYSDSYKFNKKRASQARSFVTDFCRTMNIEPPRTINYMLGVDLDEANLNLGFRYTIASAYQKYAGLTIFPNTILSCR